ncbi:MAG: ABC transporter ATP-binding protein [Proteobacteria bacterium]|nr:ABC transporter ATP-binding protein [Pseudomonadota bacterium]
MTAPVLAVEGVTVERQARSGSVRILRDLAFTVQPGETVALVGESGCGKSMTALAIMGLLPPRIRVAAGSIRLDGEDLARADARTLNRIRGDRISMIFQDPMTALNPVFTVGEQIAEVLRVHRGLSPANALARALDLLKAVDISDPAHRLRQYPHELSGGMRQRVMIAMAVACEPRLLIADEPTTALDVTVQAQVFELLRDLKRRLGMALILITHDMGAVAELADRAVVMYAGRAVEYAPVEELIRAPCHPYTQGLIGCIPDMESGDANAELTEIPGMVPDLAAIGPGCAFADRCGLADAACRAELPPVMERAPGHRVACWKA